MVICADTSFLFSLYSSDVHTPAATGWISSVKDPIRISAFNDFELRNALRFSEFSKRSASGTSATYLSLFENAVASERIVLMPAVLSDTLNEANRLSLVHTLSTGHRAFDILHVAAARIMRATHFLTFDANQKKLAESEGLIVPI